MGELVDLKLAPKQNDVAPGIVLLTAQAAELNSVLVIGWNKNNELYLASSDGEVGGLLLLIEMARKEMLERVE